MSSRSQGSEQRSRYFSAFSRRLRRVPQRSPSRPRLDCEGVLPRSASARSMAAKRRVNLSVGRAQGFFRIDAEMAREIDGDEKECRQALPSVSFAFPARPAATASLKSAHPLPHSLLHHACPLAPIEADPSPRVY